MTTFDFSPLFRTAIGFDRLARLADTAQSAEANSYPPYNIERTSEDSYCLTMAVAGFGPQDVELTVKENTLVVSGKLAAQPAKTENGLLHVSLKRVVPEALKPRRITIGSGQPAIAQTVANDAQAETLAA